MLPQLSLNKTYQNLLMVLAFLLPLTVFGANLIIVIICVLWIFSGDYRYKYKLISQNKFLVSSIIFFGLHVVGLLWTEDLMWGLHIVHKMWYFLLLLPVLYTIVERKNIRKYISFFLLAVTISELFSYLIWFEIISPFKYATLMNPTPFMSHISYNPILAFAIYLLSHEVLFNKRLNKLKLYAYSFFVITMTINMFITGGRAGHVMYFVMLCIIIFQFFNFQKIKSLVAILIIVPSIFFTAYQSSGYFHYRVDLAVKNIQDYSDNLNSSVGLRITYTKNSWELIKNNPIIGVGTGDFPSEYKKINSKNTPSQPNTSNPHNMYVLILTQIGFLGLCSFMTIFYYQIRLSFSSIERYIRDIGITMPLLFLVIMLSDSYLLGHYTTLMYVFFSSFLYRNFEENK